MGKLTQGQTESPELVQETSSTSANMGLAPVIDEAHETPNSNSIQRKSLKRVQTKMEDPQQLPVEARKRSTEISSDERENVSKRRKSKHEESGTSESPSYSDTSPQPRSSNKSASRSQEFQLVKLSTSGTSTVVPIAPSISIGGELSSDLNANPQGHSSGENAGKTHDTELRKPDTSETLAVTPSAPSNALEPPSDLDTRPQAHSSGENAGKTHDTELRKPDTSETLAVTPSAPSNALELPSDLDTRPQAHSSGYLNLNQQEVTEMDTSTINEGCHQLPSQLTFISSNGFYSAMPSDLVENLGEENAPTVSDIIDIPRAVNERLRITFGSETVVGEYNSTTDQYTVAGAQEMIHVPRNELENPSTDCDEEFINVYSAAHYNQAE